MAKKRKNLNAVRNLAVILIALIAGGSFYLKYVWNDQPIATGTLPDAPVQVHFIDVGQGDSTLIQAEGKNILIDAGENNMGSTVVAYLKQHQVESIDLLIGTHPHSDHIGGLDDVIRAFPIETIVMPALSGDNIPTTKTYTEVLEAVAEQGGTITPAEPGLTFTFGAGSLTILGPVQEYQNLNSDSVISRFCYQDVSFLITGDAESEAEKDLLEATEVSQLKSTVLRVAHHGSNTSNTASFLNAIGAQVYIISVGEGNSYGHPQAEVLERLAGKELYLSLIHI